MAYVVPQFNLLCNIWTGAGGWPPVGIPGGIPRIGGQDCALVYGRRINVATSGGTTGQGFPVQVMNLLLPALTDVRGPQDGFNFDYVEVPMGSGRYYAVIFVDDIGKGWPNEHRTASLYAIPGTWLPPYP